MTSQAIISWRNQVPVGYEPSRTLTFMNFSHEFSPGSSLNFLSFPREIRDQIYEDMLSKPPKPLKYFKTHGWQLSHKFNFAVLRVNKQIKEEASEIVYAELSLVLPVMSSWAPEWANINIGLPGTLNIRYVRLDIDVRTDSTTANYLYFVSVGVGALIRGVIKAIGQLPYLERVQVTHTGVSVSPWTAISSELDLSYDMNFFTFVENMLYLKPLGRLGPLCSSFISLDTRLLRPTAPRSSRWAIEFEVKVRRGWWAQEMLLSACRRRFEEPALEIASEHDSSEDTTSSDGSTNEMEGPDFSMIPEPGFSDDRDNEYEGPDLSMIPEPCATSSNMPPTDNGMGGEVDEADTEVSEDDAESETKSEGNNSTKTEVMDQSNIPWPYCDSRPTGRLTHSSGGAWFPRFRDYCYIDCDQ